MSAAGFFKHKPIKIYLAIWIILKLKPAECRSKVLDGMERNAIKVSEYCHKTSYCEEGSHVICMYYNPNSAAGPDCHGFMNEAITADLALKILDITNAMRAKVAQGKETGKDGQYLPKGYGLTRLKWDSELATFAQVLANQCSKKNDVCRGSSRFPDPEQNIAVIRFLRPEWEITKKDDDIVHRINTPALTAIGLNKEKIMYGLLKMMELWYDKKHNLEPGIILKFPDFTRDQTHIEVKQITTLLSGSATHMGCGLSAFSHYTHHNTSKNRYNFIVLICNVSGRPKPGQSVYETEPPFKVGYTIRCGCPPGFEEDEDCLCYESSPPDLTSPCDGHNKNCKPAVVLLPIVQAEDASASKISRRGHDLTFNLYDDEEEDHGFGNFLDNDIDSESVTYSPTVPYVETQRMTKRNHYKEMMTKPKTRGVKKRYFDKRRDEIRLGHDIGPMRFQNGKLGHSVILGHESVRLSHGKAQLEHDDFKEDKIDVKHKRRKLDDDIKKSNDEEEKKNKGWDKKRIKSHDEQNKSNSDLNRPGDHPPVKRVSRKSPQYAKESLFSRMPKFELPSNSFSPRTSLKSDVAPRKDFTNSKTLLDNYIKRRKANDLMNNFKSSMLSPNKMFDHVSHTHTKGDLDKYFTKKFNYQGMEDYANKGQAYKPIEIKSSVEESDKKLMSLLDTLEREANHIELNLDEKEIFDAKLRKIYGQVVGKPDPLPPKHVDDIVAELAVENEDRKDDFAKFETAVNNHLALENSDEDHFMPKTRPQNNLSFKEKHAEPQIISSIENNEKPPYTLRRDEIDELLIKRKTLQNPKYRISHNKLPFKYKNNYKGRPSLHRRKVINDDKKYLEKTRFTGDDGVNSRYYGNLNKKKFSRERAKGTKTLDSIDGNLVDIERRKYYQDKLERIERKLHEVRGFHDENEQRESRFRPNNHRRDYEIAPRHHSPIL